MKNLLYLIIVFLISGCIEEYNPKGIEEVSDLLVIEGTITDNESVFNIRTSVGLSEKLTDKENVNGAIVYVEKENGERLPGTFSGDGTYKVITGTLDAGMKYRLYLTIGNEEYRSEFLSPLFTPEIDSITYLKRGEGEPVNMCVHTHDPKDQSRYYMWSYKEIWEVKAELYARLGYLGDVLQDFRLTTSENTYYCWGRDYSKTMLIGATDKLSENIISQKKLLEMPCSSEKLSILYYIEVDQKQIRKEAYDYYSNIQKNVEQTGSIFAPIPSEMRGNIVCITNPDLPVIGYIEVSTLTNKSLFVPESENLYESSPEHCHDFVTDDPDFRYPVYGYFESMPPEPDKFAPHFCVDCRLKPNASKDRPDFWPNNHF